jgi:hypothetical protein
MFRIAVLFCLSLPLCAEPIIVTWTQHLALTDLAGNRIQGTEGDPQAVWQLAIPALYSYPVPYRFDLVSSNLDVANDNILLPTQFYAIAFAYQDGSINIREIEGHFTLRNGTVLWIDSALEPVCPEPCSQTMIPLYHSDGFPVDKSYLAPQDMIAGYYAGTSQLTAADSRTAVPEPPTVILSLVVLALICRWPRRSPSPAGCTR